MNPRLWINRKIILASASKRRQKILKELRFRFKIVKSNLNEDLLIKKFKNLGPKKLVKLLSLIKALSAMGSGTSSGVVPDPIVAFDTIVVCKNKIFGKPKNKNDALKTLLFLSSKEHKVYTGICLIGTGSGTSSGVVPDPVLIVDCEVTRVLMNKITREEALKYISTKEPLDKAGGYAIQGKGKKFVKKYIGDYFNIVGLPVKKFISMLSKG